MPNDALAYKQPSTPTPRPSALPLAAAVTGGVLLVFTVFICVATWITPRYFFLPIPADVGLGFRSDAGWVRWVEHAPWMTNPDYIKWSLPWVAVIVLEAWVIAAGIWRLHRGRKRGHPTTSD